MADKQLLDLIKQNLVEKGDYKSLADLALKENKQEKSDSMLKLIEPISAFADMLTSNSKGIFMEELRKQVDDNSSETSKKLATDFDKAKKELETSLSKLFSEENDALKKDLVAEFDASQSQLETKTNALIAQLITEKADSMFSQLGEDAKLTQDEIDQIIEDASLSVESQIPSIIGEYVSEHGINTKQINGLQEYIQALIPEVDFSKASINWSQLKNVPHLGGGGKNLLKFLNDVEVSGANNNSVLQYKTDTKLWNAGVAITVSATEPTDPKLNDLWVDVS